MLGDRSQVPCEDTLPLRVVVAGGRGGRGVDYEKLRFVFAVHGG